jgi:hypothetical protein
MMFPMTDSRATAPPDRFLIGIVLGAVALIAVAVGVVLTIGRAPPAAPADPASPIGVVQAYVEAVRSGDADRARSLLSQSARDSLDRTRDPFPRYFDRSGNESRVMIEPVDVQADKAQVKVTISTFSARSEPFSTGTNHREVDVRLVREGGQWRIAQPAEPFAFAY